MRFLQLIFLFFLTVVSAFPAADADSYKAQISGWSYGRERKTITGANRVTASFKIKNVGESTLENLNVTLTYKTGLGENVANALVQNVGSIKAGETRSVTVVGEFIPVFSSYELLVEFNGSKEKWFSNSDVGQPQPQNGEPLKGTANVVVLGRETTSDKAGRFSGTVRVKNEGTVDAKNLKISITFFDTKKQKIGEWSDKLGTGMLAGGTEENIPFVAAKAPRIYGGYELKVGCDDTAPETALFGGDFTNASEVEFAKFVFKRGEEKSKDLIVGAQVRNGLPNPVDQVQLTLMFQDAKKKELKRFTYIVPGQLQPGDTKLVEFTIPQLPKYDAFEQAISYGNPGIATAVKAPAAKLDSSKFQNLKDIEVIFTDSETGEDKTVALAGAVRNGKDAPVKDVDILVTFTKKDGSTLTTAEKTMTDVVRPGEERNFVLKATGAAGYGNYTFGFKYKDLK